MSNRIITISREFGSGGHTVGKKVAERLGIPCYDNELIKKIAEQSGFVEEYIKEEGEHVPQSSWLASAFTGWNWNGPSNQDLLWTIQRNIILELAEKESCVIVGRCADFILRDKNCLRVFIHASMEKRAVRIVNEYGERREAPEQRLKSKDKRRASYYRFYTDMKWGQSQNYHIALDSGELGLDKCADIICSLY
mgnify:FL=1